MGEVVPEEDNALGVAIVGRRIDPKVESSNDLVLPLKQLVPLEGPFRDSRESAFSTFSGNQQAPQHHALELLHLHLSTMA